jgi:hypothetical protein
LQTHSVFPLFLSSLHVYSFPVPCFSFTHSHFRRVRGSVEGKALCYKLKGHGFETRWGERNFSIYTILPATLDPGVYSASNRNEYQEQKKMFLGSRVQLVHRADNLIAICEPIVYTMWDP